MRMSDIKGKTSTIDRECKLVRNDRGGKEIFTLFSLTMLRPGIFVIEGFVLNLRSSSLRARSASSVNFIHDSSTPAELKEDIDYVTNDFIFYIYSVISTLLAVVRR